MTKMLSMMTLLLAAPAPLAAMPERIAKSADAQVAAKFLGHQSTILMPSRKRAARHKPGRTKRKALARPTQSQGKVEPSRSSALNAVQVYPYQESAIYRLYAAPERITDIMLDPGENLVAVAAGDTARWTVGDTVSGSGAERRTHILIKPFSSGISTNLIITTDRRTYHLSAESRTSGAMAAMRWTYPEGALMALQRGTDVGPGSDNAMSGFDLDALDFNYRISGDDPAWRPVRAFDNGRQVMIEFPASIAVGEAPPLFVVGAKGIAELVNYRVSGRYYVVDRLFKRAELRLGGKKQQIVRIDKSAKGVRR